MSLSSPFGRAPLQPDSRTSSPELPDHTVYWEPWPRRMRAVRGGRTVLDSRRGLIVWETKKFTAFYYPREDVSPELLASLDGPDGADGPQVETREDLIPGHVSFAFDSMDGWFEEDDPIYAHPRDPYHRVDVLTSSRHVVVRVGGTVVAESSRPKLLFETGLPIRYYVPWIDVATGVLHRSENVSECPYKGDGQHWHLTADGHDVDDAAWSLPHPRPEAVAATDHVCFYPDKVYIEVDGEPVRA